MEKIKVIHIHTDSKFVKGSKKFEGGYFDNTVIIFDKEKCSYQGPYKNTAVFVQNDQYKSVIELCRKADLVVLYDLDFLKARIALDLPDNVCIAWRYFGYELYKRMKKEVLSEKSRMHLQKKRKNTFQELLINQLRLIYYKLKYGGSSEELFHKAKDRINYMFIISYHEHEYLSQFWRNLPECIELPIGTDLFKDGAFEPDVSKKQNKVVVGNNKNINNNHLDIIDLIESSKKKELYEFQLLFNYGKEKAYALAVRNDIQQKPYFHLIEEFMTKEDFDNFYTDVSALVINGYRQMAMGNILYALKRGVKVYLNKKNIMMNWLLENGVKVYSVESLVEDIDNGNIQLNQETAVKNLKYLKKLCNSYASNEFQKKVYNKVMGND